MDEGIGERFLRETRHSRGHLVGGRTDWARQPSWFKIYPEAPRVALPPLTSGAGAPADAGLFDVLARRRSVREYGPPPLDLEELGGLLWAAAGVTARQVGFAFRTAPSAGGLFPIEHYVVANSVTGLEPGVYHYAVLDEALELLRGGDHRLTVAHAALDQAIAAAADAVFVWTAVLERSRVTSSSTPGRSPRTWPSPLWPWVWEAARSPPSSTTRRRPCWAWTRTRSRWCT
jgi:hypothetical protein